MYWFKTSSVSFTFALAYAHGDNNTNPGSVFCVCVCVQNVRLLLTSLSSRSAELSAQRNETFVWDRIIEIDCRLCKPEIIFLSFCKQTWKQINSLWISTGQGKCSDFHVVFEHVCVLSPTKCCKWHTSYSIPIHVRKKQQQQATRSTFYSKRLVCTKSSSFLQLQNVLLRVRKSSGTGNPQSFLCRRTRKLSVWIRPKGLA